MQLTYVDRLYLNNHQKEEIDFLMNNATKFFMTVFNALFFEDRYYKKHHLADVKEATAHFKNIEFCSKFHIGTKYANSLIRLAKDRISLHRESHKQKIEDKELKLKLLNKDIKKITKNKNKSDLTKKERTNLWNLNRKVEEITAWLNRNKKKVKQSVTFGSKKLQREIEYNRVHHNHKKYEEKLQTWLDKRSNFVYASGENKISYGNINIKLQTKTIQIEIKDKEKMSVDLNMERYKKKNKRFAKLLNTDDKKSVMILRKNNKYYIHVQKELEIQKKIELVSPNNNSADIIAGIDFNNQFISYYINNEVKGNIDYTITSNNSNKNKETLLQAIKSFTKIAQENNVNCVNIETLNFNKKKIRYKLSNIKGLTVMLHRLPYSTFAKFMEIEMFKNNIKLNYVNPAYTSQKALEQNLDRHIGAAMIISQMKID